MTKVPVCASLAILLLLAADNPLEGDKFLQKADEKFEQSMTRAQESFAKLAGEAFETRLKTYRTILAAATKAGDFDRATAVKNHIADIEAERDEVVAALPGKKKAPKIPREAVKFGGHHYLLVNEPSTWHVALRKCEQRGGHIATAADADEEAFLLGLCKEANQALWLGASDEENEGDWRWIDGTPLKSQNTEFDNNRIGLDVGIEHHLFYWPQKGRFADAVAAVRFPFLCEWDE